MRRRIPAGIAAQSPLESRCCSFSMNNWMLPCNTKASCSVDRVYGREALAPPGFSAMSNASNRLFESESPKASILARDHALLTIGR